MGQTIQPERTGESSGPYQLRYNPSYDSCSTPSSLYKHNSSSGETLRTDGQNPPSGSRRRRLPSAGSDEWFQDDLEAFDEGPGSLQSSTNPSLLVPAAFQHGQISLQGNESGLSPSVVALLRLMNALPPPKAPAPEYILQSSLSSQVLWALTAARRPPQPTEVRALVSQLWEGNARRSECPAGRSGCPADVDGAGGEDLPRKLSSGNLQQLHCADSAYSSTVSKSFHLHAEVARAQLDSAASSRRGAPPKLVASFVLTVTVQVPRFRVVARPASPCEPLPGCGLALPPGFAPFTSCHAEFLVVVSVSHGDSSVPLTFGFWKRYSDFRALAAKLHEACVRLQDMEVFGNALLSWQCVEARRRWYGRCVEPAYLALKTHLLERFLHDLLFESVHPGDVVSFLGLDLETLAHEVPELRDGL